MRMKYNPKEVGDSVQAFKSFLTGGLIISCLIYISLTDSATVFLLALVMALIGAVIFIQNCLTTVKQIYVSHNLLMAFAGGIMSIISYLNGYLNQYFGIIVLLLVVTIFFRLKHHNRIKRIRRVIRKPS